MKLRNAFGTFAPEANAFASFRLAFWNKRGLQLLQSELSHAPAAATAAVAKIGMRTGAAAFYRLPRWLMLPLVSIAWLAISTKCGAQSSHQTHKPNQG
jgi:hypothetical protein